MDAGNAMALQYRHVPMFSVRIYDNLCSVAAFGPARCSPHITPNKKAPTITNAMAALRMTCHHYSIVFIVHQYVYRFVINNPSLVDTFVSLDAKNRQNWRKLIEIGG